MKYFTLAILNQRIKDFDLGYGESKNRPTLISRDAVDKDNKLGQRGIVV